MLLRIDDKGRLWLTKEVAEFLGIEKEPTTIEAYASLDGLTLQLRRVSNASKDLPTRKAVDHE